MRTQAFLYALQIFESYLDDHPGRTRDAFLEAMACYSESGHENPKVWQEHVDAVAQKLLKAVYPHLRNPKSVEKYAPRFQKLALEVMHLAGLRAPESPSPAYKKPSPAPKIHAHPTTISIKTGTAHILTTIQPTDTHSQE